MAVCGDGMERLRPGGHVHASVMVLVRGDGLFFKKKELVYAACFARWPSLQVLIKIYFQKFAHFNQDRKSVV